MKPLRGAKRSIVTVRALRRISKDVYCLEFDSSAIARNSRPGTFLHVKIASVILRRPLSIHRVDGSRISLLFRVRGRGTKALAAYRRGMKLDVIGPLGNGFRLGVSPQRTPQIHVLVAGGIGVAPLMFLAQRLRATRRADKICVLIGARSRNEIVCESDFKRLGCQVRVSTDDGSQGSRGSVSELLKKTIAAYPGSSALCVYACGPEAMFKAIHTVLKDRANADCQLSFEQFMGCGLGICCACVIETRNGYRKVCKDGPVFAMRDMY